MTWLFKAFIIYFYLSYSLSLFFTDTFLFVCTYRHFNLNKSSNVLSHATFNLWFNRINLSPNLVTNCKECQLVQFFWKIYSISISFLSEILQIHIWSFNTCVSLLFNALLFKQVSWSSKLKIKFFLLCLNRGGEILTNYFSHLNKQGFELCSFAKT